LMGGVGREGLPICESLRHPRTAFLGFAARPPHVFFTRLPCDSTQARLTS
jgi:hypothetical protein